MKKVASRFVAAGVVAGFLALGAASPPAASAAALAEQRIALAPGWNAVFLELVPESTDPAAVFAGLPVASVWTWVPAGQTVQFVQNPGDVAPGDGGWHVWFPPSGEKAALTNLFAILPNRAYLVELDGDAPAELLVAGTPSLARPAWVPNSYNFTGFTVDPAAPPTVAALFVGSSALAGQPVYRLGADGAWHRVADPATERVRSGEAFWVFCDGTSDWAGPLRVRLDFGDALDFGALVPERRLTVENRSGEVRAVTIAAGPGVPLARRALQDNGLQAWPTLAPETHLTLGPDGESRLRLVVRRTEVDPAGGASLLEVRDGSGLLVRVPVLAAPAGPASPLAGLWVGTVRVDRVTEAQIPANPEFNDPQPTGFAFSFKIILHVDGDGQANLLKEVVQVWDDGAGAWVLAAGEESAAPYLAVDAADARRLSTAAYDFPGEPVSCGAGFDLGGNLACDFEVTPEMPTNPFRHEYHPDHDNLDALGYPLTNEATFEVFRVSREIALAFDTVSPECAGQVGCVDPPDWGHTRMAGAYAEDLHGLHRSRIRVAGTFSLRRVTDVPTLVSGVAP